MNEKKLRELWRESNVSQGLYEKEIEQWWLSKIKERDYLLVNRIKQEMLEVDEYTQEDSYGNGYNSASKDIINLIDNHD